MPVAKLKVMQNKALRAFCFFMGAAPPFNTAIKKLHIFAESLHLTFPYLPFSNLVRRQTTLWASDFRHRSTKQRARSIVIVDW